MMMRMMMMMMMVMVGTVRRVKRGRYGVDGRGEWDLRLSELMMIITLHIFCD